jgi:TonB family protein
MKPRDERSKAALLRRGYGGLIARGAFDVRRNMKRTLKVILFCTVIGCPVVAQGVLSTLAYLVRVEYLLEEKGALHSVKPVDTSLPNYDFEMLRAGIRGSAAVQFVVDKNGSVTRLTLKEQSQKAFGDSAMRAVAKWRFQSLKSPAADSGHIECKFTFELID